LPHVKKSLARWGKLSLGSLLVGVVLLLNALAASPKLHELFHADAGKAQHHCAVTLFAHGQVDAADAAVAIAVPSIADDFLFPSLVSVFSAAPEILPPGRAPPVSSGNS
jgi:hypothetical protein